MKLLMCSEKRDEENQEHIDYSPWQDCHVAVVAVAINFIFWMALFFALAHAMFKKDIRALNITTQEEKKIVFLLYLYFW